MPIRSMIFCELILDINQNIISSQVLTGEQFDYDVPAKLYHTFKTWRHKTENVSHSLLNRHAKHLSQGIQQKVKDSKNSGLFVKLEPRNSTKGKCISNNKIIMFEEVSNKPNKTYYFLVFID